MQDNEMNIPLIITGKSEISNYILYVYEFYISLLLLNTLTTKLLPEVEKKQVGNGPSRRFAQGSKLRQICKH